MVSTSILMRRNGPFQQGRMLARERTSAGCPKRTIICVFVSLIVHVLYRHIQEPYANYCIPYAGVSMLLNQAFRLSWHIVVA